ncbi:MAG: hypothetical protein WC674_09625 [Candidatus Krumholzibacteriia bacterium]
MKKLMIFSAVMLVLLAGCRPPHPSMIKSDPAFDPNAVSGILIAPFISSIIEAEDPQRQSERTMNRILAELLSERTDYKFISPEQFKGAVARGKLGERYAAFQELWATKHEVDSVFLRELKLTLNVEVLLIPHVYLWHKDEADYREGATTSATQVGAMLTLVDMGSGKILWDGGDENTKEAVRSEDRSVLTSGGVDRRVGGVTGTGRDQYGAPPFEDVAMLVLQSIVGALPPRVATR